MCVRATKPMLLLRIFCFSAVTKLSLPAFRSFPPFPDLLCFTTAIYAAAVVEALFFIKFAYLCRSETRANEPSVETEARAQRRPKPCLYEKWKIKAAWNEANRNVAYRPGRTLCRSSLVYAFSANITRSRFFPFTRIERFDP